jgi:hypothetical protein
MADAIRNELNSTSDVEQAGATAALGGPPTAVLRPPGQQQGARGLSGVWDAQRVGRVVLLSFAALIVVAMALLAFRLAAGDDEPQRAETQRGGGGAGQATEDEQETAQVVVPDILGRPFDEASDELTNEFGLIVVSEEAPSNDFPTPGVVSAADPAPGSTVSEGDTVTLTISTGPEDSGEEDEDDEDGGPQEKGSDKPEKEPKPSKDDD